MCFLDGIEHSFKEVINIVDDGVVLLWVVENGMMGKSDVGQRAAPRVPSLPKRCLDIIAPNQTNPTMLARTAITAKQSYLLS